MKSLKSIKMTVVGCFFSGMLFAQVPPFHSPVEIPFRMSGNFGEPRPNHFHCGIDVKTQGVVNKRILAVYDGYVSRMTVGLDGFGNALYITHPNGLVSVYCHLNSFVPELQKMVRSQQYNKESEQVDVRLSPDEYPVKAGEWVAYSGNTGASLAPHLHLELHRASDGALIDPLPYFKHLAEDQIPPRAHGIRIYPCPGEGVVERHGDPVDILSSDQGKTKTVKAWGRVGFAICADDYMDNTRNKFGIYRITLRVDGNQVFRSELAEYMPYENPMVNSWGDYACYRNTGRWYLKSFADPGNSLSMLDTDDQRGWVNIDEERIFNFEYTLEDLMGNTRKYSFRVQGMRMDRELNELAGREEQWRRDGYILMWNKANVVQAPRMELRIPKGALVKDEPVRVTLKDNEEGLSDLYTLHDNHVPLMQRAVLMISPKSAVKDSSKCYIESTQGYVGGKYENGWYTARIRDLGETYGLTEDIEAPSVSPIGDWSGRKATLIRYRIKDGGSGVKSWKAYADGQFVLFTRDRNVWTCRLEETPLLPENKRRILEFIVTDRCGNKTTDKRMFIY